MVKYHDLRAMSQLLAWWLGITHTGFGVVVLLGGPLRFPSPTYTPLLEFVNGRVWVYGVLFLAIGLFMLAHKTWLVLYGAVTGTILMTLWSTLFMQAASDSTTAGLTAFWAYAMFALGDVILGCLVGFRAYEISRQGGYDARPHDVGQPGDGQ